MAAGVAAISGSWLSGLEQGTLSTRFALRGSQHPRGVVVVSIDDRTFGALSHRWPFPRSWHARILERLREAGARAVFYDVQFTEPTTPREDLALFDALRRTGGATLATTETDGHGHSSVLGGDANLRIAHSVAAASDFRLADGGVIYRVPYSLAGLPTAAVAVATRVLGRAPDRGLFGPDGAYIDFQGPPGTIPSLSYSDVLTGHFPAAAVRGSVVVVGATSPSLQDVHATVLDGHGLMSGPELQANAIWTVIHGAPLRPAPGLLVAALVALAALLPAATWQRRSAAAVVVCVPLVAALYLLAAQLSFDAGVILPVVGVLTPLGVSALATLVVSHALVTVELRATQLDIVKRLGRAAESRDGETGRHLERMATLCEQLALAAGLSRSEARMVKQASALHDVGKIVIPDEVLLKAGKFTERDREIMSAHAARGAGLLTESSSRLVQMAEVIALTHHERWDGTGYPRGLAGEEIPLVGRICALCDVFDALVSRRRYKAQWTLQAALDEIAGQAGAHFDPELTRVFLRIAPRLHRELASSDPALAPPCSEAVGDQQPGPDGAQPRAADARLDLPAEPELAAT